MSGLQRRLATTPILMAAAAIALGGCSRAEPPDPLSPKHASVASPELGLRLDNLDADITVEANDGGELVLAPADPAVEGRIDVIAAPPEDGQNLVTAVSSHQTVIEDRESGRYLGAQELVTPLGPAFYSRGRYLLDGSEIEETTVFTLHPEGDRILRLRYRYPAGADSSVRVQQVIDVLGAVSGLDSGPTDG